MQTLVLLAKEVGRRKVRLGWGWGKRIAHWGGGPPAEDSGLGVKPVPLAWGGERLQAALRVPIV